jgi:outer membrane receptor for ferrienterochelin and colicin
MAQQIEMKMKRIRNRLTLKALAASIAAALAQAAWSQEQEQEETNPDLIGIEEVVAVGRLVSSSQQVAFERMEDASVVDTIGAEMISRMGDSTVAASLRRLPGLSLVQEKFVYIRGLGERYSATSLNGASIPSPDLTRNVIPLDVFPTSVVESLRVQKTWAPDLSANFGGGSVDIRTQGVPNDFELNFEFSTGANGEVPSNLLTYHGGSDDKWGTDDGARALSPDILAAVNEYQGAVDVQGILALLQRADATATLVDAQAINRSLAVNLNRDFRIKQVSPSPDGGIRFNVGNRFDVNQNWDIGLLAGASYDTSWRQTTAIARNFTFPTERTDTEVESTQSVNISGTLNLGVNFTDDHSFEFTTLHLRNTDDEFAIRDFFNENREISDGLGVRDYRFEFEERNMITRQIEGTHYLGSETRGRLPGLFRDLNWIPLDTEIGWFYSESQAETDIPNRAVVSSFTVTDPVTAEVLGESVQLQSTAATHRFTDLDDEVNSWGWSVSVPFETDNATIDFKLGGGHDEKTRVYRESNFSVGPLAVADPSILSRPIYQVFSDSNIMDQANNFVFVRQGTNNQSYLAATATDSMFGMIDWTRNERWRVAAGARWEDYRQVAVDWNPFGFSETSPQVTTNVDVLEGGTFQSDEIYPAVSLTYMSDFWAETFQLRFGVSQTAVRPDLREITDASYIDPITGDLTSGNSGVVPSDVDNLDIRAEWFYESGDSFTVTLFQKDITKPIEFFESAASDTTIAREILNADSGEVRGLEFEFLKGLGFVGRRFDSLFLQGNLTLQDSELVAGPRADAPTNPIRALSGASDYVANVMLGYDSPNGKHTATLIYNEFGERLFVAGRNGAPDGFEQPFESLDFTYFWYPRDSITFKAKFQNMLDDEIEIQREGLTVFTERPGRLFSLAVTWRL